MTIACCSVVDNILDFSRFDSIVFEKIAPDWLTRTSSVKTQINWKEKQHSTPGLTRDTLIKRKSIKLIEQMWRSHGKTIVQISIVIVLTIQNQSKTKTFTKIEKQAETIEVDEKTVSLAWIQRMLQNRNSRTNNSNRIEFNKNGTLSRKGIS